jgi:hypothetical protein
MPFSSFNYFGDNQTKKAAPKPTLGGFRDNHFAKFASSLSDTFAISLAERTENAYDCS